MTASLSQQQTEFWWQPQGQKQSGTASGNEVIRWQPQGQQPSGTVPGTEAIRRQHHAYALEHAAGRNTQGSLQVTDDTGSAWFLFRLLRASQVVRWTHQWINQLLPSKQVPTKNSAQETSPGGERLSKQPKSRVLRVVETVNGVEGHKEERRYQKTGCQIEYCAKLEES